jgi:6-phosphofructokinase 2
MIITITMNPAIDRGASIEKISPEKKLRCGELTVEAGGGGINVSKAVKELGGLSYAIFPAGGGNGRHIQEILAKKDIPYTAVKVLANTRENLTVVETTTNLEYRFVMPGYSLSLKEAERCFATIAILNPLADIFVASGSLPQGVSEDFYVRLAHMAKKANIRFVVDASGRALQLVAQEGVYLLKPNLSELASLVGEEHIERDEVKEIAKEIINKGFCKVLVVSLGEQGAILIAQDHYEEVPAPYVEKLSTVGAGDSMVGGMVWMLQRKKALSEVVKFGVACGTAATMNLGTQLFNREDAFRLYRTMKANTLKQ